MSSMPSVAADPHPGRPPRKRSKKPGTLISWRTDENLKLIAVTRRPGVKLRALPVRGQVIVKTRRRTGFLDTVAHLQALQGQSTTYRFTWLRRRYEVQVVARRDRRRRIVGVRGTLQELPRDTSDSPAPQKGPEVQALEEMSRRRRRNSFRSAIRSLELAKLVADTARVNAQIINERAEQRHQMALAAQIKAEEEGRRARLLADASGILESPFDPQATISRLAKLLVLRAADWCVFYFREDGRLRRYIVDQRDSGTVPLLMDIFPPEDESMVPEKANRGGGELFPSITPDDVEVLVPKGPRRRAFREMGVQSLLRTPISSYGRFVGVLYLGSNDPGRLFGVQDLQMARDLSSRIGLAWESARLYDEAQREIALRRDIEARLRVFNVELERRVSERTAMLEEATREANSFAYTVAHDLRAPLRAITGFCQALQDDYAHAFDPVGKDYLERVVQGARRMDDLIRDLLDYARLNRAEIRRGIVDLDDLLSGVLEPMAAELQERKARVAVENPLGRVVGQGGVLSQAITNLLSNAVKFVAPGVVPEVRIRSEQNGIRTRIFVEDNGIGIASEHQERIFGIFERLNRAEQYPGTGIGLAIVRRAVERLGGTVGVESQFGRGSRFWIELPSA